MLIFIYLDIGLSQKGSDTLWTDWIALHVKGWAKTGCHADRITWRHKCLTLIH